MPMSYWMDSLRKLIDFICLDYLNSIPLLMKIEANIRISCHLNLPFYYCKSNINLIWIIQNYQNNILGSISNNEAISKDIHFYYTEMVPVLHLLNVKSNKDLNTIILSIICNLENYVERSII